jgi:hypothetical protein
MKRGDDRHTHESRNGLVLLVVRGVRMSDVGWLDNDRRAVFSPASSNLGSELCAFRLEESSGWESFGELGLSELQIEYY